LADAGRPGALPRASDGGPIYPLAPAQPDIEDAPELQVRRRGAASADAGAAAGADGGTAARADTTTPADPTPWTKAPASGRNREAAGFSLRGTSVGRARVGYEPASRPNLPPPSDAVMSSAQVRPAPAASAARSGDQRSGDTTRPDGRALQAKARHLQSQGQSQEAVQAYHAAIAAYQDDIANGRDPRAAEYGIAASKAALDLLESSQ
jgi:hypothetical protein